MVVKYCIIPSGILTECLVDCCIETSENTVRKKLDETQAILKYHITPEALEEYEEYSQAEILTIINNPVNGWREEDE